MSTQQMWNFLMSEPQVVCQTCMVTCVSCMTLLGPRRVCVRRSAGTAGRWGATARRMVANKILYDVARLSDSAQVFERYADRYTLIYFLYTN